MARGILSEIHFNHMVYFSASFPYILTKLNAHSLFRFLGNSECYDDTNTPVLYPGWHDNEKS